jgi:hypothetical protein
MANNPPNYDIYSLLQLNEDGKPSQNNAEELRPPHQWIDHQITIAQSHDPSRRQQIHEVDTYLKEVHGEERDARFYKLLSNSRDEPQQLNQRKKQLLQALARNWNVTVDILSDFFEDPSREVLEHAKALSSNWTWNDCQEVLRRAREERKTNAGRGIRKVGGWLVRDIKRAKELLEVGAHDTSNCFTMLTL